MNIKNIKVEQLIPYINNPRRNDEAVDKVKASIQEFGFKVPLVIDKNNVVVTGHTRLKAAKLLGMEEVPCVVADDLTEAQIKAFRIADNRVAEYAEWDEELLKIELDELEEMDFDLDSLDMFDFDLDPEEEESQGLDEEKYTINNNIPQYEITGPKPELKDLVDDTKVNELIKNIKESNVDEDIKEFLIKAATRHYKFNYQNIAEYYAHSDKEVQELMEQSALIIIDIGDAIRYGYAKLSSKIAKMIQEGD